MNTVIKALAVLPVVVLAGQAGEVRSADTDYCWRCGCGGEVLRICRPICTTRREEVTCWDVVNEDICLPRKSRCIACGSAFGNDECCPACEMNSCETGLHTYGCKIRPGNKLMKKTFIKEVPVIVWVVEYVCTDCANRDATISSSSAEYLRPLDQSILVDNAAEEVPAEEAGEKTLSALQSLFQATLGQDHIPK